MRFILIGAVESSEVFLKGCIRNDLIPIYVFGLDKKHAKNVSGYRAIYEYARKEGIEAAAFDYINECTEKIKELKPEYIFVIGLSQLISQEVINCAQKAAIGLHPTLLPRYRGRAAIPWQILLGVQKSAVSFFKIEAGMDDGAIYAQIPYQIDPMDDAQLVHKKVYQAIDLFTNKCLLKVLNDEIIPKNQNEKNASYLLARREEDGLINWNDKPEKIERLVRATTKPYPGAYSYYKGKKIVIWKAELINESQYIGINGQIAEIKKDHFSVIVGINKLLRIYETEGVEEIPLVIGAKLESQSK